MIESERHMGKIDTEIDILNDLTVMTFHGEITAEEIRNKIHEYFQGEVTLKRLWNFQNASPANMTANEIKEIVRLSQQYSLQMAGGKIALVFPSRLAYGIGTMFNIALGFDMNRNDYMSFTDIAAAMEWLRK
jgi:hypothetical protein